MLAIVNGDCWVSSYSMTEWFAIQKRNISGNTIVDNRPLYNISSVNNTGENFCHGYVKCIVLELLLL